MCTSAPHVHAIHRTVAGSYTVPQFWSYTESWTHTFSVWEDKTDVFMTDYPQKIALEGKIRVRVVSFNIQANCESCLSGKIFCSVTKRVWWSLWRQMSQLILDVGFTKAMCLQAPSVQCTPLANTNNSKTHAGMTQAKLALSYIHK